MPTKSLNPPASATEIEAETSLLPETPTPQPEGETAAESGLPPDRTGFVESASDTAKRYVLGLFLHANKDQWQDFQCAALEKRELESRLNFLTNRIGGCKQTFEIAAAFVEGHRNRDLAASMADNLTRLAPGQFREALAVHSESAFIQQNADKILEKLRLDFLVGPVNELDTFRNKNAAKLKQHRLI